MLVLKKTLTWWNSKGQICVCARGLEAMARMRKYLSKSWQVRGSGRFFANRVFAVRGVQDAMRSLARSYRHNVWELIWNFLQRVFLDKFLSKRT